MSRVSQLAKPKETSQKPQGWTLTSEDRCDSKECGAQAYVMVTGVTGSLYFCAHHYNGIMDNAVGYDRMMKFAYEFLDERERLIENRLIGEN